jgi:hypothetical protein
MRIYKAGATPVRQGPSAGAGRPMRACPWPCPRGDAKRLAVACAAPTVCASRPAAPYYGQATAVVVPNQPPRRAYLRGFTLHPLSGLCVRRALAHAAPRPVSSPCRCLPFRRLPPGYASAPRGGAPACVVSSHGGFGFSSTFCFGWFRIAFIRGMDIVRVPGLEIYTYGVPYTYGDLSGTINIAWISIRSHDQC